MLGTLGASLLGNLLSGKEIVRAGSGNKRGKAIVRVGYGKEWDFYFLMPPHPLTNFEIKKHYENKPRFNGVFSRDNMPKTTKDGAYVTEVKLFISIVFVLNMFLKK